MVDNLLFGRQDDCLIAIESGRKPDPGLIRLLPPWRAVLIARIACRAGLLTQKQVDRLVEEARSVGGDGILKHSDQW